MADKRKIIVLGDKGMLGQMAKTYFSGKGYEIITIGFRFNSEEREQFINEILRFPDAIVLNCIGKIKQKTEDDNELLWANALLPLELKNSLLPNQTLVHPSTDCVFDGKKGEAYVPTDTPNARDSYGWSKRLGELALKERANTIIFRVSIIGPDKSKNGKGLLAWFLGNKPKAKLKGFNNHLWNGITTLEWCKQIEQLLQHEELHSKCVFEMGGTKESYSKFDMLQLFQKHFDTEYNIESCQPEISIDRRLMPTVVSDKLETQLKELIVFEANNN